MKKILPMKTPEEVKKAFEEQGVEISLEEVEILGSLINKSIEKGGKPLSEEDLSEIAGGFLDYFKFNITNPYYAVKTLITNDENDHYGANSRSDAAGDLAGDALKVGAGALIAGSIIGAAWAIKENKGKIVDTGKKVGNKLKNVGTKLRSKFSK